MKTNITIATLFAAALIAEGASAQNGVDRRVEVTRRYIPEVGAVEKLDYVPAMVDTVTLRPETNYSITPTPWKGSFKTVPLKPIKISAAQFHVRQPFFLRLAAGWPLQSLADLYATANTSPNAALGVYANHYGRWFSLRNDLGNKENATATYNAAGIYFEKQYSRKVLNFNIFDSFRYYRAMGGFNMPGFTSGFTSNANIFYNDLGGSIVFGDRFVDLSHFNFRVGISAGSFFDFRKNVENNFGTQLDMGWMLGSGDCTLGLSCDLVKGAGSFSKYSDWRMAISPKYVFNIEDVKVGIGFDYIYNNRMKEGKSHLFPQAELSYVRLNEVIPYIRMTGSLEKSDYRSLSYANPYILRIDGLSGEWLKNPSHCGGRVGAHGSILQTLSYDIFFEADWWSNYIYFANDFKKVSGRNYDSSRFIAMSNKRAAILSFGTALSAAIVRGLSLDFRFNINQVVQSAFPESKWSDGREGEVRAGLGIPQFGLDATLKYTYRNKVYLSAGVEVTGQREFSAIRENLSGSATQPVAWVTNNTMPVAINLKFDAEFKISEHVNAMFRGDNLLNKHIYQYNHYPLQGASAMLGLKIVF